MNEIEQTIINICNRKMMAFILQDLKCQKCQQIRRHCLSRYCSCSGSWMYKEIQVKDLRKQLAIVKRKAEFHGMTWLTEVLTSYGISRVCSRETLISLHKGPFGRECPVLF